MRILFLCNKSPWPPREGGPMAMNMLIEGMANQGHQVKVLAVNSYKYHITDSGIPADYREKTGLELIGLDLKVRIIPAFLNLFTRKSYHVERFISRKFENRLREILSEDDFDIVQMETIFMSPYINIVRKYSRARVVLRAHNIEHLIWKRVAAETRNPLKSWYIRHLSETLRNYEMNIFDQYDGIVAITPNDADFFRNALQQTGESRRPVPVTDLPFGMRVMNPASDDTKEDFPSLFTIGSMNWIPNQEGVKWFVEEVWPDVHNHFPDLKYYLAGREMPEWMLKLDLPNIVVLGEVPDAREFMESKSVMIVPLFSGSGIRIKIIEGMAAGKAIISTTLGAEGIQCTNQENILLADRPCEFFEMISICVTDRQLCRKIGSQARSLVSTSYEPGELIKKLQGFYLVLLH